MNPGQVQKLRELIQTSPLFREAERAEWTAMLELMNDKQLLELAEVLRSVAPIRPVSPSPAQPEAQPQTPPAGLSHITNLPPRLDFGQGRGSKTVTASALPQVKPANLRQAWQEHLRQALQEKELSAPHWTALSLPRAQSKSRQAAESSQHAFASQTSTSAALKSPARGDNRRQEEKAPAQGFRQEASLAAGDLKGLAKMDAEIFRQSGYDKLAQTLRDLVRQTNYFDVSFQLERSPLYKSYLNTGRKLLELEGKAGPLPPGAGLLSRAEFEKFTDLLRAIQVN